MSSNLTGFWTFWNIGVHLILTEKYKRESRDSEAVSFFEGRNEKMRAKEGILSRQYSSRFYTVQEDIKHICRRATVYWTSLERRPM